MMSSRIIKRNSKLDALRIFQAAVEAVLPNNMVNSLLSKNSEGVMIGKTFYPLKSKRVSLVGFGKAVLGMAHAIENVLGEDLHSGILSVPLGTLETLNNTRKNDSISGVQKIKIYEGAQNNLPDKNAFIAAEEIMKFVEHLDKNDLLLVLISGGGSALLPVPIPPITLEEKCHVTRLLSNRGANIRELNTVRKELSAVKGGKLALAAAPAKVISLILSDVIGDELDLIASGPTVPPCSNWKDAMAIIEKYNARDHIPLSILGILAHRPEADLSFKTNYDHVENFLIGSNATALQAAKDTAEKAGYSVCQLSTQVCGEAKSFAHLVVQIAWFMVKTFQGGDTKNATNELLEGFSKHGIHAEKLKELQFLAQNQNRIAILSGGETVVQVVGTGYGGRNQETALACSLALQQTFKSNDKALKKLDITFLSAGTDGQDGPTTAAGAFAYMGQLDDLNESCSIQSFLSNNDSNSFYKQFKYDDLVITGVTGTNVMDIHILLIVFDIQ